MQQSLRNGLELNNESGVKGRVGPGFRSPSDFAVRNLCYVIWSNEYCCDSSYYVTHDPGTAYYALIHVIEGSLEVYAAGRKYTVDANEAIFLDFRQQHYYKCAGKTLVKWEMILNGETVRAYYQLITETWGNKFRVNGRVAVSLKKIQTELEGTFPQDHKLAYMIQKLFSEIIEQHTGGVSQEISKAIRFIYDNYEKDIRIEDVANHVSLSRSYFSKIFLKETGYTPKEYLLNVRINMAQDLLLSKQSMSLLSIAENCGFANASHFCKLFKKKVGKSPKAFRDNLLGI